MGGKRIDSEERHEIFLRLRVDTIQHLRRAAGDRGQVGQSWRRLAENLLNCLGPHLPTGYKRRQALQELVEEEDDEDQIAAS